MGGKDQALDKEKVLEFYKREDIQDAIYEAAADKEIGIKYDYNGNYGYGKRPDVINNPADVLELVKQGATSFHFSEELWFDPMQISTDLSQKDTDKNRKGWDLVIDIDTPHFEYSKLAAHLIAKALKHHGIKSLTCKFSGNHGFHLAVPFEAFPNNVLGEETRLLFPEGPRRIAIYLKEMISKHLSAMLLRQDNMDKIANNIGKEKKELIKDGLFDPFEVVDIDTLLISSRHLCRMPYAFNEKSGLISIPIKIEEIMTFKREYGAVEKVKIGDKFLNRENVEAGEASDLIIQAFDFEPKIQIEEVKKKVEFKEITQAIPEQFFPPCIKKIFEGMDDGKKRGVFILINFLSSVGWSWDMIDERLKEWNKQNKNLLKEVYIKGQLNYAKKSAKKLPPNCNNEMYYTGMNICLPDNLCGKMKNPVNYSRRKAFANNNNSKNNNNKKKKDNVEKKTTKENQ